MIRFCETHGYVDGESCPVCGSAGQHVLDDERRTRLSKFVSGALRHFPDDAGLSLDDGGWVAYESLVDVVCRRYPWVEREHVDAVVATDPKGRFERRERQIRAAYGHSVDVTLDSTDATVPDRLYHGTARRNVESIVEEGLRPMGRQQVHLSATVDGAREVGRRHDDDPVVLVVDAAALVEAEFDVEKRGHETYTVARVPPAYLSALSGDVPR